LRAKKLDYCNKAFLNNLEDVILIVQPYKVAVYPVRDVLAGTSQPGLVVGGPSHHGPLKLKHWKR
jgi:hypothetical protein